MNICVFGAASNEIDNSYIKTVEEMGLHLARSGHNLVFGAGALGLMGAAARGFKQGNGTVTGVIPTFFQDADVEAIYDGCDELIFTETMRERKAEMENRADAFIIVPGGIGTFEELFEIMTLKQLGRHNKPIMIYNINGYYSSMEAMLERAIEQNFLNDNFHLLYQYCSSYDEIVDCLNSDSSINYSVKDVKNG